MRTLNRYIGQEVLKGSAFAALVLLAVLNFFTFADELRDLGQGNYGLGSIFLYLTLNSPHSLYELIPSAALIGSLVTLGNLANARELVAMQAAGMSRGRIVAAVLRAGLLLSLTSVLIGEYVAPPAERAAQMLKASELKQQVASQTRYGFWVRDGNVFVNIRELHNPEQLGDIHIFDLDGSGHLTLAVKARQAVYEGMVWALLDLDQTHFRGMDGAVAEHKERVNWSSVLSPDLLNVFVVRPENLSAYELYRYLLYQMENAQKSLAVEQALWARLIHPIVTLAMLLLAIPFVLDGRREISIGQRIVIGVTIGLGFYLLNRMVYHLGLVYELDALATVALPPLSMLLAGWVVNQRRI